MEADNMTVKKEEKNIIDRFEKTPYKKFADR